MTLSSIVEGRFVDVNESFLETTGYSRNEIVGRTSAEIDLWVNPKERDRLITTLRSQPAVRGWECSFRMKNGDELLFLLSAEIVRLKEEDFVLAAVTDITERQRLEQQLFQAQKMEAVGRLAGGVAHDFNNWLTPIIGYSQLLLHSMEPNDPHRREVEEIGRAGERASALASQLLAFSRKQVLQPVVVNLNEMVARMETMLRRVIAKDISLVTQLATSLDRIKADQGQIEQVLLNLALNARDAMPQGGELRIETSNVEILEEPSTGRLGLSKGRFVVLTVSDTGCGMDAETQSHIFEPFFTTKQRGKGTGLGLSTVYGIVRQSGGSIQVQSEVGKGTTFAIHFPSIGEAVEPAAPHRDAGHATGTETILVVEDQPMVRDFVSQTLRGLGYTVFEASGGEEALSFAQAQSTPIHLLLTDVIMPKVSGTELAARFVLRRPDCKVLYMSGYPGDGIVSARFESDPNFIQKPFTPEALARKIREVLES
jgi:PAS domain S-box-containing protein